MKQTFRQDAPHQASNQKTLNTRYPFGTSPSTSYFQNDKTGSDNPEQESVKGFGKFRQTTHGNPAPSDKKTDSLQNPDEDWGAILTRLKHLDIDNSPLSDSASHNPEKPVSSSSVAGCGKQNRKSCRPDNASSDKQSAESTPIVRINYEDLIVHPHSHLQNAGAIGGRVASSPERSTISLDGSRETNSSESDQNYIVQEANSIKKELTDFYDAFLKPNKKNTQAKNIQAKNIQAKLDSIHQKILSLKKQINDLQSVSDHELYYLALVTDYFHQCFDATKQKKINGVESLYKQTELFFLKQLNGKVIENLPEEWEKYIKNLNYWVNK